MRQHYPQKPPLGTPINWAHPLTKGLVGFWLFNESGGDLANDLSGNGNHGTINNMAFPPTSSSGWNAGRRGTALSFDGSNDYVISSSGPNFDNQSEISISMWVKVNSGVSDYLIELPEISSGSNGVGLRYDSNTIDYHVVTHSDNSFTDVSGSVSLGRWYHIALIYNGVTLTGYKDGVSVGSHDVTLGTGIKHASGEVNIGRFGTLGGSCFQGQIDEVRIYNRALSAQEIKQLYYSYADFPQPCNAWLYAAAAGGLSIPVAMHNYRRLRV
jgi:hypothetical protein